MCTCNKQAIYLEEISTQSTYKQPQVAGFISLLISSHKQPKKVQSVAVAFFSAKLLMNRCRVCRCLPSHLTLKSISSESSARLLVLQCVNYLKRQVLDMFWDMQILPCPTFVCYAPNLTSQSSLWCHSVSSFSRNLHQSIVVGKL